MLIRSRQGTDLTAGFPEIAEAAAALPARIGDVVLDGELIIWGRGKLAFNHLQSRIGARPATARRLAAATPAHLVAFDLLHLGDLNLLDRPYRERRALLEHTFGVLGLAPPWELCPASTDPETITRWLTEWPSRYCTEGVVMKRPDQAYRPAYRGWRRYRIRASAEAVIAAVTGSIEHPDTLLLARFDTSGELRYTARTTPLTRTAAAQLTGLLNPADDTHPWHTRKPVPRWNRPDPDEIVLAAPEVVAEFTGDLAKDPRTGVFRHLVRFARTRPDLALADLPPASTGRKPTAN